MLDKSRLHALAVSAVVAFLLWGLALVPIVLGDEENSRRAIARAVLEKTLVAALGVLAAHLAQPWSADAINALIGVLPIKLGVKVDAVTSSALVVALTVTFLGEPKARTAAIEWAKRLIPGFSK